MSKNDKFFKSSNEEDLYGVSVQPKVLTLSGLPLHENISINSITPIDSHQYDDKNYFSLSIDGNPIAIQSLCRKIPHTASTLTLEWFAKNCKQNDGLFFSPFANASVFPSEALHERDATRSSTRIPLTHNPLGVIAIVTIIGIKNSSKVANIIPDSTVYAYSNFKFTINAITISDIDGESLILRAKLEQGEALPTHRSLIPPKAISVASPSAQV